ncbi:MAG: PKD domain-containing protein, partial [Vulcanimicrobiaceae bacterium]
MRVSATILLLLTFFFDASPACAQGGTIAASTTMAYAGQPITFVATLPTATAATTGVLAFGDGATAPVPGSATVAHVYALPGIYSVTLTGSGGVPEAQTTVRIQGRAALVPTGSIYSVTPTLSPVLAGSNVALVVTYAVAVPTSIFAVNAPRLEFLVDLLDAEGQLLRRSDPYVLAPAAIMGTQIARIPYSIPVDAAGAYAVRVYLRAPSGGTIALAQPVPLMVVGGPDPAPQINNTLHANGALEIGPQAGSSGDTFNAGMTTALVWPNASLGLSGLYDPVSRRSDPVLTYSSGVAQHPQSPDASGAGSSGTFALDHAGFTGTLGRTQSSLPSEMGGGDQIRGLDATAQNGPFTYHAAYGFTELAGALSGGQYASIFEVGRSLPRDGSLRLTSFSSVDQVAGFVPGTPGAQPQAAQTVALEYTQKLIRDTTVLVSGAVDASRSEAGPAVTQGDSADTFRMNYANGPTTGSIEYDNAGPAMALGGAPGALTDRSSFAAQMQAQLSNAATLAFGWNRNDARSALSRSTDAFATMIVNSARLPTVTLTLRRDDQLATGVSTNNDQLALGIMKSAEKWNLSFNGTLSAFHDLIGASSSTTRTGSLQYMRQSGTHTLSVGLNATAVGGIAGTTQTGGTVAYGFPFATSSQGRGFELQLEGDDSNTRSPMTWGLDRTLSAIL